MRVCMRVRMRVRVCACVRVGSRSGDQLLLYPGARHERLRHRGRAALPRLQPGTCHVAMQLATAVNIW